MILPCRSSKSIVLSAAACVPLVGLAGCTAGHSVRVKAERSAAAPVEVRVVTEQDRIPVAAGQRAILHLDRGAVGYRGEAPLGLDSPSAYAERVTMTGELLGGTSHWLRVKTADGEMLVNRDKVLAMQLLPMPATQASAGE